MENLMTLLERGINPALRYQHGSTLLEDLAQAIMQHFEGDDLTTHLPRLAILIKEHDYRLVAEYLFAWRSCNQLLLSILYQMITSEDPLIINKQRYRLAYARFEETTPRPEKATVSFTDRIDEVFSSAERRLVVYLRDERYRTPLLALIAATGAALGEFIEQQYDLPGLNAVVRQGVVRKWHLPDGTAVVSKRQNPQKEGRFRREQIGYSAILNRISGQPLMLHDQAKPGDRLSVQIAYPFAVIYDGYSNSHYALSVKVDGISLEDIFMADPQHKLRARLLRHYRLLLDKLYEHGILWGDMSPRNILVQQRGYEAIYTLVDFEKTTISDTPISLDQRIEHCRGQICVEELGVLCLSEEVLACFKGYFNPSAWEFESTVALPFPPRPEIAEILRERGIENVTLGVYNTIDRDIMSVRIPYHSSGTKARRFPGHLGFKVEHYLSCVENVAAGDYDRKTTEVLMAAKRQDCFDAVVMLLAEATNVVESAFLKAEFINISQGGFSGNVMPPQREIENLTQILDVFYQRRERNDAYQLLIAQLQSGARIGLA